MSSDHAVWFELGFALGIPLLLIVVGRFVGAGIERRHFESLLEREQRYASKLASSTKTAPGPVARAELAIGSVVVSVDYFKRFTSGIRMLFGGEVRAYSSLIERARREALLRMKESQPEADAYINTRIETSTISTSSREESRGTIEVVAYGTAVTLRRSA